MAHKPRALAAPPAMRPPRRRAGPLFSATQSRLSGRQRGNLFAHLSDVLKLRPRQISGDDGPLWRPAGTFSSARHAGTPKDAENLETIDTFLTTLSIALAQMVSKFRLHELVERDPVLAAWIRSTLSEA